MNVSKEHQLLSRNCEYLFIYLFIYFVAIYLHTMDLTWKYSIRKLENLTFSVNYNLPVKILNKNMACICISTDPKYTEQIQFNSLFRLPNTF